MDVQLPDGTGIEATRAVLAAAPGTPVLMLTMLEEPDTLLAAVRAGARGYMVKGATSNAMIAERLGISAKTVANYVSSLLTKLQVTDRTEAALLVRRSRRL